MADEPILSDSEVELWRSFYSMRRTLDRALDLQLQRDSQLSASEYEILIALNVAPQRQLRVKDLAGAIGWEKSRVSHLVSRMEKRELLLRTECNLDARGTWIALTTEGRRAFAKATRGHMAAIRRYFLDVLEPGDEIALAALSGRVVGAIGCGADEDAPLRQVATPGCPAADSTAESTAESAA